MVFANMLTRKRPTYQHPFFWKIGQHDCYRFASVLLWPWKLILCIIFKSSRSDILPTVKSHSLTIFWPSILNSLVGIFVSNDSTLHCVFPFLTHYAPSKTFTEPKQPAGIDYHQQKLCQMNKQIALVDFSMGMLSFASTWRDNCARDVNSETVVDSCSGNSATQNFSWGRQHQSLRACAWWSKSVERGRNTPEHCKYSPVGRKTPLKLGAHFSRSCAVSSYMYRLTI